jgi:uncharacterized membrane protein/protein-disulfide isomerase
MKLAKWLYLILGLTLLSGLALSVVSYLELCSVECRSAHDWKLFDLPFGPIGIAFFSALLVLWALSWSHPPLRFWISLGIVGALGAEVILIYVQKVDIGHWCPVCLGIAASIALAAILQKGEYMKHFSASLGAFIFGFLILFVGISHENPLEAMETSVKERLAFGNPEGHIQLYLFTDWACPACRALEPKLMQIFLTLSPEVRFHFVDIAIHPETLNYSPYNMAFMVNNKPKYLELRDGLTQLAIDIPAPSQEQIEKLAHSHGTRLKELNYADISIGLKYWKDLASQFDIDGTPILVIVNPTTKKGKKLSGLQEITESNISKAISALK